MTGNWRAPEPTAEQVRQDELKAAGLRRYQRLDTTTNAAETWGRCGAMGAQIGVNSAPG